MTGRDVIPTASHIVGFCWHVVFWFVVVMPYSPSLVALYWARTYCFTPIWASTGVAPADCLMNSVIMAPAALVIGPLAGAAEDVVRPWPAILGTALALALLITTLRLVLRRRNL